MSTEVADGEQGVWIAHYWDGNFIPFASEVECLRWATENHADGVFVPYGTRFLEAAWRRDLPQVARG